MKSTIAREDKVVKAVVIAERKDPVSTVGQIERITQNRVVKPGMMQELLTGRTRLV